jgi:hypothetical protein
MHNQKNSEVSFYLVKNEVSDDDVIKNNLSGVVLDKLPILTTRDIIEYSQRVDTILVTKEALIKFRSIKKEKFAICVGNQPVLLGQVWSLKNPVSLANNGFIALESFDGDNKIIFAYNIVDPDESDIERIVDYTRRKKLILDSLSRSNKLVK